MKIILADQTELSPILVMGENRFLQGANRDTLSFIFPADAGLDALDAAFSPEACETITVEEDDGSQHLYKGYTIRAELKKEAVMTAPETPEAPAVLEERIAVGMAQKTYMESQLASLRDTVDILVLDVLLGGEQNV